MNLIGTFHDCGYHEYLKSLDGWNNVIYYGQKDRNFVAKKLANSLCGIVTFLPVPNHVNSLPNKLFEYLSAGLPVIASDFNLWKKIIHKNNCVYVLIHQVLKKFLGQ